MSKGFLPKYMQREGQFTSDAFRAYVRSHGKDAIWVAIGMAKEEIGNAIQPRQGTHLRQLKPIPKLER